MALRSTGMMYYMQRICTPMILWASSCQAEWPYIIIIMIIAVYHTATNMNLLLAGMHKMEIGTGLRVLGGSLFVMLSVVAIPAYKRLHAAHQLRVLLSGSATFEKLVGLLVHCWILACMHADMIDDMCKPLAHMRRSFQGGKNTLDPRSHPYQVLIPRWEQWFDVVATRSAAAFSAALGSFNADMLYVLTTHVYGDAFRDDDPQEVDAGIGPRGTQRRGLRLVAPHSRST